MGAKGGARDKYLLKIDFRGVFGLHLGLDSDHFSCLVSYRSVQSYVSQDPERKIRDWRAEEPTPEPFPEHPPTLSNEHASLGSAAVGAALSSVPLLRSGLGLEKYSKTVGFLLGGGRVCFMGSNTDRGLTYFA